MRHFATYLNVLVSLFGFVQNNLHFDEGVIFLK